MIGALMNLPSAGTSRSALRLIVALVVVFWSLSWGLEPATAAAGNALQSRIAACDAGDRTACRDAGMILSDAESTSYDAFLSLRFLQLACTANEIAACGRLALIFYAGEGDVERDLASAANFAARACTGQDRDGCEVAEAVFSDGASPQFDAAKALRYRRINCNFGNRQSCIALARIYYALNEHLQAEQIALTACKPGDPDSREVCAFGKQLQDRRRDIEAQQQAQRQAALDARAQKEALFKSLLAQRDYGKALYYALYYSRSVSQAEAATLAASRAGALQSIPDDLFYVLQFWFRSGPVAGIAASEIAKRERPNDCGIFDCTNTPGASSRRWEAQNGRSGSSRSSAPYRPDYAPAGPDVRQQVRDQYRQSHCGGAVNANSPTCRR